jgi:DNA-binding transcriptional regulator YdaS (Cro superfamily)
MTTRFATVREMIAACGERGALAERLGVTPQAICLWVTNDRLPAGRIPDVLPLLREGGVPAVEADLWPLVRRSHVRPADAAQEAA